MGIFEGKTQGKDMQAGPDGIESGSRKENVMRKIRYAVQWGHLDGRGGIFEDEHETIEDARREFEDIDIAGMWVKEYDTSNRLSTDNFDKAIVENVYTPDDDGEWTLDSEGDVLEFESFGYDDYMFGDIFQEHELEAFLGEPDDFDIEGIVSEATGVDGKGNRRWLNRIDLNDIAERNRK